MTPQELGSFCAGVELTSANWNSGPGTFSDMVGVADDWLLEGAASPTHVGSGSEQGMDFDVGAVKLSCPNVPILGRGTIVTVFKDAHDGAPARQTFAGPDIAQPAGSYTTIWHTLTQNAPQTYLRSGSAQDSDYSSHRLDGSIHIASGGWDGATVWSALDNNTPIETLTSGNTLNLTGFMPTAWSIGAYKDGDYSEAEIYAVYFFADCLRDSGELPDLIADLMTRYGI